MNTPRGPTETLYVHDALNVAIKDCTLAICCGPSSQVLAASARCSDASSCAPSV